MRETAWKAAEDFWTKELKKPGLPSDVAAFGKTRLTEINQILKELNESPRNPVK